MQVEEISKSTEASKFMLNFFLENPGGKIQNFAQVSIQTRAVNHVAPTHMCLTTCLPTVDLGNDSKIDAYQHGSQERRIYDH